MADLGAYCAVRDSKNTGIHFLVSQDSWTAFISWIRQGESTVLDTSKDAGARAGPSAHG